MKKRAKYFTLLELIIVVSIIGILAAIAIPNLLKAQTRAKVSGAQSNIRVLTGATEAYRVDWNDYPPMTQKLPEDPYGILCDVQLRVLNTPVSYVSPSAFNDPFGNIRSYSYPAIMDFSETGADWPVPQTVNKNRSLLYYHYYYFSRWTNNPLINTHGVAMVSIGPDRKDSFGAFRPFSEEALPPLARLSGINHPDDTCYDPTNGAISGGDLSGFAGSVSLPH